MNGTLNITGSLPNDTELWRPSLLHPGSGRSSSAEQSFVLGPECFREETLPRDTQCWGTWEHHSAVSNGSIWCVFFTWPGSNQSPDSGWVEEHFYSRYQHLSLLPIVLSFSAAWCTIHFPRTACSKSCPLYPPILSAQITVISINNLRSPTQFHLQIPMSHSEQPPAGSVINLSCICRFAWSSLEVLDLRWESLNWVLRAGLWLEMSRAGGKVKEKHISFLTRLSYTMTGTVETWSWWPSYNVPIHFFLSLEGL